MAVDKKSRNALRGAKPGKSDTHVFSDTSPGGVQAQAGESGAGKLDKRHLRHLRASGLSEATIKAAGLHSTEDDRIKRILKWQPKTRPWGQGLVFPFFAADGKLTPHGRVKLDDPRTVDGKVVKYESPRGSPNRAYFPPGFSDAFDKADSVLVTDGEKRALAAMQAEFACVGLASPWAWQCKRHRDANGQPSGVRLLLPVLASLKWRGRKVYVVFVSDAADRPEVRAAETALAKALESLGATVHVVRLPPGRDGAKVGLDDFMVARGRSGPAELRDLLESAPHWAIANILGISRPNSMELATAWLHSQFMHPDGPFIRYWRNDFWLWTGACYRRSPTDDLHKRVLRWLTAYVPDPTPRRARDVLECVASQTLVADSKEQPVWLGEGGPDRPRDWIAMENGILDLPTVIRGEGNVLRPHSPLWFSPTVLSYPYDPTATCPSWEKFLDDVLDQDEERINLLAEWFGYCLTSDTSLQAILLMEGPRRSGKGTTLRVFGKLVGLDNCVHPRLSTLDSLFGLWGLVGKSVAICPDVHLAPGSKALSVLEILKSISGEDAIEVHRKNLPSFSCRLPVRFTLSVNELPRFADASNALASRLHILPYRNSYVGREDRSLEGKLAAEVQGIFLWAIEGLRRLRKTGRFTQPHISTSVAEDFARLSSPLQAFMDDSCVVGPTQEVSVTELWNEWKLWCVDNGHKHGSKELLGMRLRNLIRGLDRYRPHMSGGGRSYFYKGIGLNPPAWGGPSGPSGPSGPRDLLAHAKETKQ